MLRRNSWITDIFFITLLLSGLFFILLGVKPLFTPDEGRYAEIAREMVVNNDYITPTLNGVKYFEKPVLFYWLEAAAIKVGGLNLWSLRSINALLGLLGCLATYFTARKLYGRKTGLYAAFILGTSLLYFTMVHMISLDLPVTVFLTLCLYALLLASQESQEQKRRLYFLAAASMSAFAVLTKGLIGIVFPSMIFAAWVALSGQWRLLTRLYLPMCLLLFFAITAPWHVLVSLRNPEFFYFYFIEQQFLRYTTEGIGHYQPNWFFIPNVILGFFPWIVFLPQAIYQQFPSWKTRLQQRNELFLLLWIGLVFTFFSFSHSKLIPYILPIFPPLAILTGHYLAQGKEFSRGIRFGFISLIAFSMVIAYVFYQFPKHTLLADGTTASVYLHAAAITLLLGSIVGLWYARRSYSRAIIVLVATISSVLLTFLAAVPAIDTRSIRPLVALLKTQLHPADEVIAFNQYYQDLPFYLERRISILNWQNELRYGMDHQDTHDWMINDQIFWDRWHSNQHVYVIISTQEYKKLLINHSKESIYLLGQTATNSLVSNVPPLSYLTH